MAIMLSTIAFTGVANAHSTPVRSDYTLEKVMAASKELPKHSEKQLKKSKTMLEYYTQNHDFTGFKKELKAQLKDWDSNKNRVTTKAEIQHHLWLRNDNIHKAHQSSNNPYWGPSHFMMAKEEGRWLDAHDVIWTADHINAAHLLYKAIKHAL